MEIESLDALGRHLEQQQPLRGVRLQNLDLTAWGERLAECDDLTGLVVLGGEVPPETRRMLWDRGAIVFPGLADAPVDPWRGLYVPADLYAGIEHGYESTPDALAYAWFRECIGRTDAYATLVRAIHDDSVTDELDEFVAGRDVVGIMGGHALQRDSEAYAGAARLGHQLAESGFLVATGGGPGAMEAANLGAQCRALDLLDRALEQLARVPSFHDSITHWAQLALTVREQVLAVPASAASEVSGAVARSIGVPTWFYGHEPPNVFCDIIAKYFSNAIREDGLLARCHGGVVVLPGAAGTVQEVFQAVTPLYYASPDKPLAPLVLVNRRHWTETVPVWPTLQALARGRPMERTIHLVESVDEVGAVITGHRA